MKKFFALSLIVIGLAFLTPPVNASTLPPNDMLTVSASQLQLDPIVLNYAFVEQTVSAAILQPFYVYQARAVMPEIVQLGNLPKPPVLYNITATGLTALNHSFDRSRIPYLTCIYISKQTMPYCNYRISMRQVARNAVISENAHANHNSYNLHQIVRA